MYNNVFSQKAVELRNEIMDYIEVHAQSILGDYKDSHFISLNDTIYTENGETCDRQITSLEFNGIGEVVFIDDNYNDEYTFEDNNLSIDVYAQIADCLSNEDGYNIEEKAM
jgi:hypothetical protein